MISSSNPLSNSERIIKASREYGVENTGVFAVRSACTKAGFMIALCFFAACLSYATVSPVSGYFGIVAAVIVSLIAYFIGIFVPSAAKVCGPVYAVCEGAYLGWISSLVELRFGKGLCIYALLGTISVSGIIFVGYMSGLFKVNSKVRNFAITLGLGLMFVYLANLLLPLFGMSHFTSIADTSFLGFAINVIAIAAGSIFLLIDFDNVFELDGNVDSRYEWVWGMGFLASLVWIYIELLKLAVKISALINGDD